LLDHDGVCNLSLLQVANNPLNFSKPCLLSTTRFPIESVFLQVNSHFSAAVFGAQKECIMASAQADCTARKANISSSALQDSMKFKASEAPAQLPARDAAAVDKPGRAPGDEVNAFAVAQFDQLGPTALLHLGDVAGGTHKDGASAANDSSSEAAHGQLKTEGKLEGGPLVQSVTAGYVTAEQVAASKQKIVRWGVAKESAAVQPAPFRASWASNLPLPLSILASLAQARTLPSIPVPTASGPLPVPLPVPRLPRLSSNSTGSGCTTVATCRAAFVSLKKLRVIQPQVDLAAAMPLESQSLDVGPANWQLGVPRP
jgi:hypothetical protein